MKYFLFFLAFVGFTGLFVNSTNPAYAMCGFDSEKPFAPCEDTLGTLEYPKTPDEIFPAPLKQMKLGIKLGHILCDPDKLPVWNTHYKPACIFENSEGELLKRGWAKLRLMLPAGPDPITELGVMGNNVYSLQILGSYQVGDEQYPLSENRKKELAWDYSQQYHPGEIYLEYAITPHQNFYNTGNKVQFDLLEWGNYKDCWDLKIRILDVQNNPVYEDNQVKHCLEPDESLGVFHSYSMGEDFEEFVCNRPGYYRIQVSNGDIFAANILENFVCLDSKPEPEPTQITTEVQCFSNQIIYNNECIYVLAPTDEFPEGMSKYFLMVDVKIINFCQIEIPTSNRGTGSGVTLDRCFEVSEYTISDVNVIEFQSTTPPTWINIKIKDLTRYVELGSFPTFQVIESGWGNGCTHPTLEVYQMRQENGSEPFIEDLIYKHSIVYSCPWYQDKYPPPKVLRIWDESDFPDFPVCTTPGRFLIIGDSGYERIPLEDYYCGIEKTAPTIDDFREILSKSDDIETIFSKFGEPQKDIGSGIHIYVYELEDSTQVWIGYTDRIWYVRHVDSDGNILEKLFEEN